MLPECNYNFGLDKPPLLLSDINIENYKAISEYLRDNFKYDHPGEPFGKLVNTEGYEIKNDFGKVESKYLTNGMNIRQITLILLIILKHSSTLTR